MVTFVDVSVEAETTIFLLFFFSKLKPVSSICPPPPKPCYA